MALCLGNLCLEILWCGSCCHRCLGSLLWHCPLLAIQLWLLSQSLHKQTVMDKMFQATTVIAVLLLCLGILYSPCQVHHKFFSNPIDSVRIIAPFILISSGAFFLQACQLYSWCFWGRLVALEFFKGKTLVGCGLVALSVAWVHGLQDNTIESSFSTSWAVLK